MGDDDEACSCDVCATGWHSLMGAQKLEHLTKEREEHDVAYWRTYAEQLEAENYDLTQENTELREELSAALARCPECGRHK